MGYKYNKISFQFHFPLEFGPLPHEIALFGALGNEIRFGRGPGMAGLEMKFDGVGVEIKFYGVMVQTMLGRGDGGDGLRQPTRRPRVFSWECGCP